MITLQKEERSQPKITNAGTHFHAKQGCNLQMFKVVKETELHWKVRID